MATSLGELRVEIGADTRSLREGEKVASQALDRVQGGMARVERAAKAMAAALAASFTIKTLINLGSEALQTADQMGKVSQQVGLTVESLSALTHAAGQSGLKFEEFRAGLLNLSKGMNESLVEPTSRAARTFDALGIALRDSQGNVKSTEQVLMETAGKLSQFQDGANKSALAMGVFGEEGVKLIPMLNQGSAGLRQMMDEAKALGAVIDSNTSAAATRFNDNLGRLRAAFDGVVMRVTAQLAPTLDMLSAMFLNLIKDGDGLKMGVDNITIAVKALASAAVLAAGGLAVLVELGKSIKNHFETDYGALPTINEALAKLGENFSNVLGPATATLEVLKVLWSDTALAVGSANAAIDEHTGRTAPLIESTAAASEAQSQFNQMMNEGTSIMHSLRSPYESMIAAQVRLNELLLHGAIDAKTFEQANLQATAAAASSYLGLASSVGNSMSQIFNKNKAVAIASAIANTAQSVTKTLAQYGATPWGIAAAAAAAVAGAAQIATIRRTTANGGGGGSVPTPSMPAIPSGSSSSSSSSSSSNYMPTGGVGPVSEPEAVRNNVGGPVLTVRGLHPSALITGDVMRDIVERIIDWQRDGGTIALEQT